EDHAVAKDAGDVDENIDAAEGVDALADHVLAALGRGDAVVVGDRLPSGGGSCFGGRCVYLVADLVSGAGVMSGAVDVDARGVDGDVGALLREEEGDGAADAAAGAGDDGGAVGQVIRHG